MVFHDFDRIRVVNLADRTDRRHEMVIQLARVGLTDDPRVAFFEALSFDEPGPFLRKGSRGAFESHLALLREAAEADQSILILQDDCDFLLPQACEYEMPECDIFYGGYSASNPADPSVSDIIGAHLMGFSVRAAKAAAQYLEGYLSAAFVADPVASAKADFDPNIRPPIDGALVWFRRAHPELKTVFAMLGVQRASRTDIGDQRWFDRVPLVRDLAERVRVHLGRRHSGEWRPKT